MLRLSLSKPTRFSDGASRPRRRARALTTIIVLALTAQPCGQAMAGYGTYVLGPGIKAVAMGGLSYALAEESYVFSTNPALGAGLDERFDYGIDLEFVYPSVTIRGNLLGPEQTSDSRYNIAPIPQIGFARRISERWTWGASAFFAGVSTDYQQSPYRRFGADERITIALPQAGMSLGVAYEPWPGQSVGIGANLGYNALFLKGGDVFAPLSDSPSRLSNQGSEGVPSVGYTLGWYGKLTETVAAGISYRSKSYAERIKDYAGLLPDRGRLEFPALYGAGITWMPRADLSLGVEYQRIEYASERAFGNRLENLLAGHNLGSRNGPGFGWSDVEIYKVGAAWDPVRWLTVRAGYARSRDPYFDPSQTFFGALAPSFAETHYTLGFSIRVSHRYELSMTASQVKERTVNGNGSIPLLIRTGPLGLVPVVTGGGEADIRNPQSQISISVGRTF